MTEEDKQNIKEQFKDIVSNGIAPILKVAGFKKRGDNFLCHSGEMDLCINIQKGRWGFDNHFNSWQFTINIGVTWNEYTMCLFGKSCDFPTESSCPLRTRIGSFNHKGDWFTLRPYQEHTQIKELICTTIKDKVLPLLNNIKNLNDTWEYIADEHIQDNVLKRLFHKGATSRVFWVTPIGLYMLYVATGKTEKAISLKNEMEQRNANTELLDKIIKTYEIQHCK